MCTCVWGSYFSINVGDSVLVSRQNANRDRAGFREGPPVPHFAYPVISPRVDNL